MTTRHLILTTTFVALGLTAFAGSASLRPISIRATGAGAGEPTLDEVRHATERFRDVKVALAEGYIRDPFDVCETAEMMGRPRELGAMGIHYFRPDMLGITAPPAPRVAGFANPAEPLMCLAIPGQVMEVVDAANRLARVNVAGVERNVNVGLLDSETGGVQPGDWVLIHVGFALSKVDEEEAHATLRLLERMGESYEQEIEDLRASVIE